MNLQDLASCGYYICIYLSLLASSNLLVVFANYSMDYTREDILSFRSAAPRIPRHARKILWYYSICICGGLATLALCARMTFIFRSTGVGVTTQQLILHLLPPCDWMVTITTITMAHDCLPLRILTLDLFATNRHPSATSFANISSRCWRLRRVGRTVTMIYQSNESRHTDTVAWVNRGLLERDKGAVDC